MDNKTRFREQTRLMVKVLPDVMSDKRLVLHGGSALNLFHFNMTRFSMDIDLRWFEDNTIEGFKVNCHDSFKQIKELLIKKGFDVIFKEKHLKLKIREKWKQTSVNISITVDISKDKINGLMPPTILPLCEKAKKLFNIEDLNVRCLNREELFGNKFFVGVLRQMPKDVFDSVLIKKSINYQNPPKQVRRSILYNIITPGYDRPMIDFFKVQRTYSEYYFDRCFRDIHFGTFSYKDYLFEKEKHIQDTFNFLTEQDKHFLLSVQTLNPNWDIYDFSLFPSVKKYLQKASYRKKGNPLEYNKETKLLEELLFRD